MSQLNLLPDNRPPRCLAEGAWFFPRFALDETAQLRADLASIFAEAPLRHLVTPGGHRMSVAMTNCGDRGWVSGALGYRYATTDPDSGRPWPPMPDSFTALAVRAAIEAGFPDFTPNVCLINRYEPGARLTLHQDLNERDLDAPIVTVSLGLPAVFIFGGLKRNDPTQRIKVEHGDMVVWGGPSRMFFHGVLPVPEGNHHEMGKYRVSLTFREA